MEEQEISYSAQITSVPRNYLPANFKITDWSTLEPYFKELLERPIGSRQELESWLRDISELEAVIGEDAAWRQIRKTCDTENKELEDAFTFFVMEIQPKIQPYGDKLNRKLVENEYTAQLSGDAYKVYLRNVKKNIELFREQNIPLHAEIAVLAQQYGVLSGKMSVEIEGREYTLQQAAKFLENPDRNLRETVYYKIQDRRLQDKETMNDLFSKLLGKRHQVAINAGFENFRDYKFADLGRFDYTKEDCFQFHKAVQTQVLPLVDFIYDRKRQKLGLTSLRPWDTDAEPKGVHPLTPFSSGEDPVNKTIECFNRMNPFFW